MSDYNRRDLIVPLHPANPVARQSIGWPTAAMYGTGKENWLSARVGIRGAFAAVFGGHSWGIRGHSRVSCLYAVATASMQTSCFRFCFTANYLFRPRTESET